MPFKVLFIAHARDADNKKHGSLIDTVTYHLHTVVVKNQGKILEVSRDFAENMRIDCILLCPGFTHNDVAEIVKITGGKVSVPVARGDGPGVRSRLKPESERASLQGNKTGPARDKISLLRTPATNDTCFGAAAISLSYILAFPSLLLLGKGLAWQRSPVCNQKVFIKYLTASKLGYNFTFGAFFSENSTTSIHVRPCVKAGDKIKQS